MENYSPKIFNLNMDQEKRAKNLIKYLSTLQQSYFVNYSLEDLLKGFFKNEKKYSSDLSSTISENQLKKEETSTSIFNKSIFITLDIRSPQDYGIILLNRENRKYFPGYKENFLLETDMGIKTAHVTSGREGDKIGDRIVGNYLVANLPEWYRKHKELKSGSIIRIDIIERDERYSLSIHKV